MARVRHKDTRPELIVRRALHAAGLRFRLHAADLAGRPDIIFRSRRIAVFVHGCFWHRHPSSSCKLTRTPKTRLEFWEPKFEATIARDRRNYEALEAQGWRVLTIWECELAEPDALELVVSAVRSAPKLARKTSKPVGQ